MRVQLAPNDYSSFSNHQTPLNGNSGHPFIKLGGTYSFNKTSGTPVATKKGIKFVKKIGGGDKGLRLKSRNKELGDAVNKSNITIKCDY